MIYAVDRTKSSRMGWSDVALSMNGPIVSDLVTHFVDRWYERLPPSLSASPTKLLQGISCSTQSITRKTPESMRGSACLEDLVRHVADMSKKDTNRRTTIGEKRDSESTNRKGAAVAACLAASPSILLRRWGTWAYQSGTDPIVTNDTTTNNTTNETATNDTVANAPTVDAVRGKLRASNSLEGLLRSFKNYIYKSFLLNLSPAAVHGHPAILRSIPSPMHMLAPSQMQSILSTLRIRYAVQSDKSRDEWWACTDHHHKFFITATSDEQRPVSNKIGAAIVDRIVRAYEEGQPFKVWVVMPSVPAFAGDLKSKEALGTRAIMEFQYNSISRGGHSIIQKLVAAGIENPREYIGFYNLRNYDRINTSGTMQQAEYRSGVSYEDARRYHDDYVNEERYGGDDGDSYNYDRYQRQAQYVQDDTLDTVSAAYMKDGPNIVDIPWDGAPEDEFNAFVSEQLYIHSKLLIADDRVVICGSANLNDRSQLGTHDSEIAVVIEGPRNLDSYMNGEQYAASEFAASLRRQIFRKHLGLLPDQRWDRPDQNWLPVTDAPNDYDWGSSADRLVEDPLSPDFLNLWEDTASINTEVFSRAFHPVPDDHVRTWDDYEEFFSKHFIIPSAKGDDKKSDDGNDEGKVPYGHAVREEFPGGVQELKEWLSRIRGTLINMPLQFLIEVDDIAKEGLTLNGLTDELYT